MARRFELNVGDFVSIKDEDYAIYEIEEFITPSVAGIRLHSEEQDKWRAVKVKQLQKEVV